MGECDEAYSTYVDGKWTSVVPLEESFRSVRAHIEAVEKRNKYLEEENAKLKDEAYKDKELSATVEKYNEMQKDIRRGFPISEKEEETIKKWIKEHEEEKHGANYKKGVYRKSGAIGGSYTYKFVPTSIGTFGSIHCSCGDSFTFQEV